MPLVTLTVRSDAESQVVDGLLNAAHAALMAIGVPEADRFQRVLRVPAGDLRYDPTYPDLKTPRSNRFALFEVTLSVGRTLKLKRKFAETLVAAAEQVGVGAEDVMIVFSEVRWENWSFGGARFFYT